jgi:hypothetical protein
MPPTDAPPFAVPPFEPPEFALPPFALPEIDALPLSLPPLVAPPVLAPPLPPELTTPLPALPSAPAVLLLAVAPALEVSPFAAPALLERVVPAPLEPQPAIQKQTTTPASELVLMMKEWLARWRRAQRVLNRQRGLIHAESNGMRLSKLAIFDSR